MILVLIIVTTVILATAAKVFGVQSVTAALTSSPSTVPVVTNTASSANVSNDTGMTVSNSDQSLTGSYIAPDPSTWPGATPLYPDQSVWNICTAVALAEGFNQGVGTAPYDLNNPGDLSPGDESGQAVAGPPQVHDGSSIIMFATCEGGFIALYKKFANIRAGKSKVYPVTATWTQVAKLYAGNWQNWLNNVTSYLGVDPNSTPAQYTAAS